MIKKKESLNKSSKLIFFLAVAFFLIFSFGSVSANSEKIESALLMDYFGFDDENNLLFDKGDNSTGSYADGTKINPNLYLKICAKNKEDIENKFLATFYVMGNDTFRTSTTPLKIYPEDINWENCTKKDIDFSPARAVYPGLQSFILCDDPSFPNHCLEGEDRYELSQSQGFFNGSFKFDYEDLGNKVQVNITEVLDHEGEVIDTTYFGDLSTKIIVGLVNKTDNETVATNTTHPGVPITLNYNSELDDFHVVVNGFIGGSPTPIEEVEPLPPTPSRTGGRVVDVEEEEPLVTEYYVSPGRIELEMIQKELKEFNLRLTNTGETEIDFSFSSGLDSLVLPSDFTLGVGKQESVNFVVHGPEEIGVHQGWLIIDGNGIEEFIPVRLNVKTGALFDVFVGLLPNYDRVYQGEVVKARTRIENLGVGLVDVEIKSYISKRQEEILSKSKSVRIETEYEFTESFVLPHDLEEGEYLFNTKISYNNITLVGSDSFYVKERVSLLWWWILLLLLAILILILIIYIILKKREGVQKEDKEIEEKARIEESKSAKIAEDLFLLDKLDFLAMSVKSSLSKNKLNASKRKYEKIRYLYGKLGNESKKEFYYEGMRIYRELKKRGLSVLPLSKPKDIVSYRDKKFLEEIRKKLAERRNVETRRNLFLLSKLDTLTKQAYSLLDKRKLLRSRFKYNRIRRIYNNKLKNDFKWKFYHIGMELYNVLKEEGLKVSELDKPE